MTVLKRNPQNILYIKSCIMQVKTNIEMTTASEIQKSKI